jgi:hypothetical protein
MSGREGGQRLRAGDLGGAWEEDDLMQYLLFAWHLLPTVAVVVLALFVVRAVSVRVVWRGRDTGHFDDEPA